MSLEYCARCTDCFLTEADDYIVVPRENYALICYRCFEDYINELRSSEDERSES